MMIIEFEPVLDGVLRESIPKQKVNGYKSELDSILTYYTRGNIRFIVTTFFDTGYCSIQKFDLKQVKYLSVTHEDFHKFIDIKVVN